MSTVVFVGAADEICAATIDRFKAANTGHDIVTIEDATSVRAADLKGASLVVLGAGAAQVPVEMGVEQGQQPGLVHLRARFGVQRRPGQLTA